MAKDGEGPSLREGPVTKLDIRKVLDISTGHLPQAMCDAVEQDSDLAVYKHPDGFGYIVAIPMYLEKENEYDEQLSTHLRERFGNAFVNILERALAEGCWAVNFDRDAYKYEDLFPLFEW